MSEKIFTAIPTVTQEDFLKFLSAKTSSGVCAACGMGDFYIVSRPQLELGEDLGTTKLAAIFQTPIANSSSSYVTAAVACKNCGWVRHHSVGNIDSFSNQAADDE